MTLQEGIDGIVSVTGTAGGNRFSFPPLRSVNGGNLEITRRNQSKFRASSSRSSRPLQGSSFRSRRAGIWNNPGVAIFPGATLADFWRQGAHGSDSGSLARRAQVMTQDKIKEEKVFLTYREEETDRLLEMLSETSDTPKREPFTQLELGDFLLEETKTLKHLLDFCRSFSSKLRFETFNKIETFFKSLIEGDADEQDDEF